jgi:hypothetical protein
MIGSNNAGDAASPQVAMGADGNAFAVWPQFDGVTQDIWANRYTAGTGWGTAGRIEINSLFSDRPRVVCDAGGNAFAVWEQSDGVRLNIRASRYRAGAGWDPAVLLETNDVGSAQLSQVGVDAAGNAIAVWEYFDGVHKNVLANRYVPGIGWGSAIVISNTADSGSIAERFPQIAVDIDGNATVVWHQLVGQHQGIWANRYTTGVGWGVAMRLDTGDLESAFIPQVAADANGNVMVVWAQFDGVHSSIWADALR